MKIAVLGTGGVGRTLAGKFASLGHHVVVGTRDVDALMARSGPGPMGEEPFSAWQKKHPDVRVSTFRSAASEADLVVNATNGAGALAALDSAGPESLVGKIVIDVSNPLDFSRGFPPSLIVANTDSLAEQIQRRFPDARVVKTLNTVTASLMVDPGALADGEHDIFISGNDASARAEVRRSSGTGWAGGT